MRLSRNARINSKIAKTNFYSHNGDITKFIGAYVCTDICVCGFIIFAREKMGER